MLFDHEIHLSICSDSDLFYLIKPELSSVNQENKTYFFFLFFPYILAHYDQLAEEILYQCDGKIDAIVVGTGTGGTMTGIARKIKEKSPNTLMVGADPFGSILAMPQTLNEGNHPVNKVQGIGYDFVPRTCER